MQGNGGQVRQKGQRIHPEIPHRPQGAGEKAEKQQQAPGCPQQQERVEQHIASCRTEQRIESRAAPFPHFSPYANMQAKIDCRHNAPPPSCRPQIERQRHADKAKQQISPCGNRPAETHHSRAFSRLTVVVDITIIIHHQHIHAKQPDGYRTANHIGRHISRLQIKGETNRHKPEKHQHRHVAQSNARKRIRAGAVCQSKNGYQRAHGNQFPSAERNQPAPHGASSRQHQYNGLLHGIRRYVAFRHATAKTGTAFFV